ncbi:MAG: leucine--tRNA ligase [Candidatus Micrarchaeaceae archaeon]
MIDYSNIEAKWQKAWEEGKIYEADPNERKPVFVTAALPYVNMPQHIGHLRTYSTADMEARYLRMKGLNVLYPMAFHKTGTPILAIAKRVHNGDKELFEELKTYGIDNETIQKMADPKFIADYFTEVMEKGMRRAGYSIDWRRKFDTIDPRFSKMVEWQFLKLKEKGLLVQGEHPVGWCTNENNVVGQHDTMHDVQPKIEENIAIKFKDAESDIFFLCATFRPETIYGVTNIFINKGAAYVIAKIGEERFYIGKEAAAQLSNQKKVEVESDISAEELLKKRAIDPITGTAIPVLPGFFVKSDFGTGVVMSVPAHAPFDYAAIERLKAEGYNMPEIEYKKIIEVEPANDTATGQSKSKLDKSDMADAYTSANLKTTMSREIPALAYLELMHADPYSEEDILEEATKIIYREESRHGIMLEGPYKGLHEAEARAKIKTDMLNNGNAIKLYLIANEEPVYCRCGTRAIVKIVNDQWFIDYGNAEWKQKVRSYIDKIKIYPSKLEETFKGLIEWIDLRAAERAQGFGTHFPFNPSHIIESLSDSTIYMTFYTFDHILSANNIAAENLKPSFFDYIFDYREDIEAVSKDTGIEEDVIKKCKDSINYWYTDTHRHSAPDLVPNHLTMYIFAHIALLPERFWPKSIIVNGFVNFEGQKMSKSMGNIIPLLSGAEKYGIDPLRFIEVAGADLDTDTNFEIDALQGVYERNEYLYKITDEVNVMQSGELSHIDYWLYSKLNRKIKEATAYMDSMSIRNAYTRIYYDSVSELAWYKKRGGKNGIVLKDFLEGIIKMLSPIMPYFSEELWHMLGNKTFISKERWPEAEEKMISDIEEKEEDILKGIIEDTKKSIELSAKMDVNIGKKISVIKIIVSEQWKSKAYSLITKKKDIGAVMNDGALSGVDRDKLAKFLSQFSKNLRSLNVFEEFDENELLKRLNEAKDFIEQEVGAEIEVESEAESKSPRAARSLPEKPAIEIVWK